MSNPKTALIIGGGPAGLMAAQELATAGVKVTLLDAKPSVGRKFLMAGKSGLNLTKDEPFEDFLTNYSDHSDWLTPALADFGPQETMDFARSLGIDIFTGSTRRVFPNAMKASPLLRAWLARLDDLGVVRKTRHRWTGWTEKGHAIDTPDGPIEMQADATIFALGGASWAKLGSDGKWAEQFEAAGISCIPFAPSNCGLNVTWSPHMAPHFGTPLKAVRFSSGPIASSSEAVISAKGIEGGGIYALSPALRAGKALTVDMKPAWSLERTMQALARPRGKSSLSNHIRKSLKLGKLEVALLQEWTRPLPVDPAELAKIVKNLPVKHAGFRPLDEAISTAGGIAPEALTPSLMLKSREGQFCAGEMLGWDAPTGGYLITGCLATGKRAARGVLDFLGTP